MQLFQIVIEEDWRKITADKSEKLKVVIIKYYDISKICFVQFLLFYLVNLYSFS